MYLFEVTQLERNPTFMLTLSWYYTFVAKYGRANTRYKRLVFGTLTHKILLPRKNARTRTFCPHTELLASLTLHLNVPHLAHRRLNGDSTPPSSHGNASVGDNVYRSIVISNLPTQPAPIVTAKADDSDSCPTPSACASNRVGMLVLPASDDTDSSLCSA